MSDKAVLPQVRGFDAYPVKLGDLMRGERATLGKSLLDVQRDLRIKASYIAAIENCDPTVFQTPGFIAGYVRSYARYLALDPEATFVHFCREAEFDGVRPNLRTKPKIPVVAAIKMPLKAAKSGASDPFSHPRAPFAPAGVGVFDHVSASGLGSVAVLLALILGLGYGAWAVLQDIQRVEFVPVDDRTTRAAGAQDTLSADQSTRIAEAALDRLYRPQELEVPVMVPRDGPIAGLDPNRVGALLPGNGDVALNQSTEEQTPVVSEPAAPVLAIVATRPAWVRVSLADGSVLFEKVLDGGESFQLPVSAQASLLRAGNSGAVYLSLDGKAFGPVGQGTSVVKGVSLTANTVARDFAAVSDVTALKELDSPRVITLNDVPPTQ